MKFLFLFCLFLVLNYYYSAEIEDPNFIKLVDSHTLRNIKAEPFACSYGDVCCPVAGCCPAADGCCCADQIHCCIGGTQCMCEGDCPNGPDCLCKRCTLAQYHEKGTCNSTC